jgi:Protein of unknown function (DUF732)
MTTEGAAAAVLAAWAIWAAVPAAADPTADPGDVSTLQPRQSQVDLDERFLDDLGLGGIRVVDVKQVLGDAHQICAARKAGQTEQQIVKLAISENHTLTEANAETLVESAEAVYCQQLSPPGSVA